MKNRTATRCAIAAAAAFWALGSSAGSARAQTTVAPKTVEANKVEEVVVTAQKRSSTVQKTPLSITAITSKDLNMRGLESAQQLVQAVPGIAVTSAGPGQAQYEIRGLSANGGESPTIGFYLDEASITPPATATTGKSEIDPDISTTWRASRCSAGRKEPCMVRVLWAERSS